MADIGDFVRRAKAVRERNKILESVPGSGFHANDRDAHNRLAAPHMRHLPGGCAEGQPPLPRISDNVVSFTEEPERKVRFYGEDATRVYEAIHRYYKKLVKRNQITYTGTEKVLAYECAQVLRARETNPEVCAIWLDRLNDFFYLFELEGIGVSGLPHEESE